VAGSLPCWDLGEEQGQMPEGNAGVNVDACYTWACACQWSWAEKNCDQVLGGMLIGLARIVLLHIPIRLI
jgi:hypothetical protein